MANPGLNLPALQTLQNKFNDEGVFHPSGENRHPKSIIDDASITTEQDIGSNDLAITANFKV
jgi:hypothetical protein